MINTAGSAASAQRRLLRICPRCGLSIRTRAPWLAIEHCPRCLARDQIPVRLFSSPLPTAKLYSDGMAPSLEPQQTVKTVKPGGR